MNAFPRLITLLLTLLFLRQGAEASGPRVPPESSAPAEFSIEVAKSIIAEASATDPIAGIWQSADQGAVIAILPETFPGNTGVLGYTMVVIEAPSPEIQPGTPMGAILPTAKAGSYDATLYTAANHAKLHHPRRFTMNLSGGNRLSITRVHDGLELVPWKILPYVFRPLLRERRDRQRGLDGFLRLWPVTPQAPPIAPRKL